MKQHELQEALNYIQYRKNKVGHSAFFRTAIQSAVEAGTKYARQVWFTKKDMEHIASAVGGTYKKYKGQMAVVI
jgi:hypothetical protein